MLTGRSSPPSRSSAPASAPRVNLTNQFLPEFTDISIRAIISNQLCCILWLFGASSKNNKFKGYPSNGAFYSSGLMLSCVFTSKKKFFYKINRLKRWTCGDENADEPVSLLAAASLSLALRVAGRELRWRQVSREHLESILRSSVTKPAM
jgi:hypothetical protein